jgi:hypothetical protein
MARDVDAVYVGADGRGYVAPRGTTGPTSAAATLNALFKELGWLHEDGLTEAANADSAEIKAWDGTTVRKVMTSSEFTFQLKFLETNKHTLELYYSGSDVSGDGGTGSKIAAKGPENDRRSFVFDVLDGDHIARIYIPDGEVTERGDISYANGEAIAYEVTITAYPDSTGVSFTKFFDKDFTAS